MRKLFYAVVALSLFATSCAKDEAAAPEATAKTKTVTFSVKAPELKTRAAGDGASATTLYYAFYDESGAFLPNVVSEGDVNPATVGVAYTDGSKEIEVTLVDGKSYTAIFWAQNANSGYTVSMNTTLAAADVAMNYDAAKVGNSENYDAFWACVPAIENVTEDIPLYRPFAQLNIGVKQTDVEAGVKAGVEVATVQAIVGGIPSTFDLETGVATDKTEVTFDWVEKSAATLTIANGTNAGTYDIYSTNYVLVGKAADKTLSSVKFNMSEEADGSEPIDRDFGNAVPVQANYRTYILGDIVTGGDAASKSWTVVIDPDFEDADEVVVDNGIVVNP